MDKLPWVDGLTFPQMLERTVERHGKRKALAFPGLNQRWNYRQFHGDVRRLALALLAIGVAPGKHVGIWCTNWPQWVLTQFATARIGAVLVNVNPAYRKHELAYILKQADIDTLILTDRFKASDYEGMMRELVPDLERTPFGQVHRCEDFPKLRHVISIKDYPKSQGIWPWPALLDQAKNGSPVDLAAATERIQPHDPVNIQYTSGTTGNPKGATLSHRNLLMNAYYIGDLMHITEEDRLCIPVPLYHCFGCVMGTLMCAVYGAAMVVPAESFDPDATLKAVEKEQCTALYGVPTMFNAELHSASFRPESCASLRTGIMAGSPCPIELMKQVTGKMHLREMAIAYGLTEASPVITGTKTDEPIEIRVSTVGKELPGVEVRIVDPVSCEDVPDGEQGELWARGHGVMLGYYKNEEATKAAITEDGWLRTGDLALRTKTGHYRITGRIKDMIIRGGENIYPREIEEFLLSQPKVRDVQVVGVPDVHFGEQVSAWIIPDDPTVTEKEIRAFCKGQIAHYKIPHYIQFVDEYPLTVTGKVQKFKLRERAIQEWGLTAESDAETA